jgi:hypothetical protein
MVLEPNWRRVWLEARAAGRNPVAALVAAGLCAADKVAVSENASPSRPPPGASTLCRRSGWRWDLMSYDNMPPRPRAGH